MTPIDPFNVRWMLSCDLPAVLDIERSDTDYPWKTEDFKRCMHASDTGCLIAVHDGHVVGFAVYRCLAEAIELLKLVVDPNLRRLGFGRTLLERITGRLEPGGRKSVGCVAREDQLSGHLFLRSLGFRAVLTCRDYYGDDRAGYVFRYEPTPNPVAASAAAGGAATARPSIFRRFQR